jgi:hypothetical protein
MKIIKKNNDIIQKTNGVTIKTRLDEELMTITSFSGNINEHQKSINIGQANHILNVVPNVLASQTLSQAYRVVMPEGAVGNLMRYKNGLLGTPIVDPITHRITAHAGLASLNPSAVALGVFTAASFATGQYFMAEIHKELKSVKVGLKKIEGMLEDAKISEVQAAINFIEYAETNLNEIILANEHKIATLTNVQRSTNLLSQNSVYYERQIKRSIDNIGNTKNTKEIEKNYNALKELIGLWLICTYGYFYGKAVEIKISENFNPDFLNKAKDDLMEKAAFFSDTIKKYCENLFATLDNSTFIERGFLENVFAFFNDDFETKNEIKADNIKLQFAAFKKELDDRYSELCTIPNSVEKLLNLNNGFEFIVKDDKIYFPG